MIKFNLYIKGIPKDATDEELKQFFAALGEVRNARIMRKLVVKSEPQPQLTQEEQSSSAQATAEIPEESKKEELGESLGFGYVSFLSAEAAAKAKLETKTMPFKGQILFVNQFEPKAVR